MDRDVELADRHARQERTDDVPQAERADPNTAEHEPHLRA
jgi:hypothetical protein